MSLPPFSGLSSRCPKCGLQGLKVAYIERASLAAYGTLAYQHGREEDFPCMQRACATCGFAALEAPLSPSDALLAPQPPHAEAEKAKPEWVPLGDDSTCGDFPE